MRARDVFDKSSAGGSNIIRVENAEDDKGSMGGFDEDEINNRLNGLQSFGL